jgi:hypothetical protein
MLYPVTPEQQTMCAGYSPLAQDFDAVFRRLNVLPREEVMRVKARESGAFPSAAVVCIDWGMMPRLFTYRRADFFRVRDYRYSGKYRALPSMAAVKLFGSYYIALNAVDVRADTPIIAVLND